MKHCTACGFDNEDTAKFCTNCGKTLPTVAPIPPEDHSTQNAAAASTAPPQNSFAQQNPSMGNRGTVPPQGNGIPNQTPKGAPNPNFNQNPAQNQAPGFFITSGTNPNMQQPGMNQNPYGQNPGPVNQDPFGQPAYTDRRSYSPRIRPLYIILMLPSLLLFIIFLIGTFMDWTGFPFLFLFGIPSYMFFKFATTPRESETITIKTNIPRQYRKGNFIITCITLTILLTFVGIAIVPM